MAVFVLGVQRYRSLWDVSPWAEQQGRLSPELVGCSVLSQQQFQVMQCPIQMDVLYSACQCCPNPKLIKSPQDRVFPFLLLLPSPSLGFSTPGFE